MPHIDSDISTLRSYLYRSWPGDWRHVSSVVVREEMEGHVAWEGVVHAFTAGEPPRTCYAWYQALPDRKRRAVAVLREPPITSESDAVRAAIVAEVRQRDA